MRRQVILQNGTKNEAYKIFDEVKGNITDFKKESVGISGTLRNDENGWNVVKVYY